MLSLSRPVLGGALFALTLALASGARADADVPAPARAPASPSPPPQTPQTRGTGFAVLAQGNALDAAWPLAKALYARDALRPSQVDEAHARVLAGEPPPEGAPSDLRDLAETRAAIRGDDAPSRQLLAALATTLHLRGIVMVEMPQQDPSTRTTARARIFLPESGFDAAEYKPDPSEAAQAAQAGAPISWGGAVRSLERAYGPAPISAPPAAVRPIPPVPVSPAKETDHASKPFYTSPWFWGAVGAAAFAGGAVFLATRDNSPSTIHLNLQVPK